MFVDERRGEASFTDLGRRLDQLRRLPLGVRWWWRLRLVVEGLLHDALRGLVFGSSIDLRGNGRRGVAREGDKHSERGRNNESERAITGDRMGLCQATGRVRSGGSGSKAGVGIMVWEGTEVGKGLCFYRPWPLS